MTSSERADDHGGSITVPDVPPYHRQLRAHLESAEPELWEWFAAASDMSSPEIEQAELDLLKSCYRMSGGAHDVLVGYATLAAGSLGLAGDVTLYQELGSGERNARVVMLADDVHVVFGGDLLDLLTVEEQQWVLAHELAHVALWRRDDRAFHTLDHLVHRLDTEPVTPEAVTETARRLRLHTEVWADAVALELSGDRRVSISSIVKVHAGLRHVDPDAYLRQAEQILESDDASSRGWTHPELHVRVACLGARALADPEGMVARLIEGPDDLDRLDLLGQLRVAELTQRVLLGGERRFLETDAAAPYRNEFYLPAEIREREIRPLGDGELGEAEPSIRYLCAALLVDLALSDRGDAASVADRRALSLEAQRIGVETDFDKILSRATERPVAEIRALRANA